MTRVVVNGTFDILHLGHIRLLEYAKSYPNATVLVLIDSDRRVKQLKGHGRPINSEIERKTLLENLKTVDHVDIFDTDIELTELLKAYNADIMVKGSDYQDQYIIGKEYCKQIVYFERIDEYSSTKKIQNIINRG